MVQPSDGTPGNIAFALYPQRNAHRLLAQHLALQKRISPIVAAAFPGQGDPERSAGPLSTRLPAPGREDAVPPPAGAGPAEDSPLSDNACHCRRDEGAALREAFPGERDTLRDRLKDELARILADEARRMGIDMES